jgi:hypothetical protein
MRSIFKKGVWLLSGALLFGGLSSCSVFDSFFGEEDTTYSIKDVITSTDDDGNTIVTITFTSSRDPITFTLPKGNTPEVNEETNTWWINGQDTGIQASGDTPYINDDGYRVIGDTLTEIKAGGVGISSIVSGVEDGVDGIYITLTDGTETFVPIPTVAGKSITDVTSENREDGIYIIITYELADGTTTTTEVGPLTKGEKGDQGYSIVGVTTSVDEDGNTTITFTMNDSDEEPTTYSVTLPAVRSIDHIVAKKEGLSYVLYIYYTDDLENPARVSFDAPNTWFSGNGSPTSKTSGNPGDFYYDKTDNVIRQMDESGTRRKLVTLEQKNETYTVTFNANGGSLPSNAYTSYTIAKGKCFYDRSSAASIPVPTWSDDTKVFDGWYTSTEVNPTLTKFTDLTPVTCDIYLFAHYVDA